MSTASQDVRKTSREGSNTVWAIAILVATASIASAGALFHQLGEYWAIGSIIALLVDMALCAWLRMGNRLKAFKLKSTPGLTLEITTAAMALFINVGAAISPIITTGSPTARVILAIIHGFGPVILVLASLAGGDAYLKLRKVEEQEAERERREADELAEANRDLNTIRGTRAAERDERETLRKEREQGHKDRLTQEARHRQELSDAEIADATRLQQERDKAATEDATRSLQDVQQARDEVATARATLAEEQQTLAAEQDQARQAAEERRTATAAAHAEADEREEATGQAARRAQENLDRAAELDREAERLRSKARRTRERVDEAAAERPLLQQDPTVLQSVSQPLSQRHATVSQPPSQTVSRDQRRKWARDQIVSGEWEREHGSELTGADIDRHFGPPRTGAAILREIKAAMTAELEEIASGH